MVILLVTKKGPSAGVKVIVRIFAKSLSKKVIVLMEQNRKKEAFDLVASRAHWEAYVPEGKESYIKPDLTLIEEE